MSQRRHSTGSAPAQKDWRQPGCVYGYKHHLLAMGFKPEPTERDRRSRSLSGAGSGQPMGPQGRRPMGSPGSQRRLPSSGYPQGGGPGYPPGRRSGFSPPGPSGYPSPGRSGPPSGAMGGLRRRPGASNVQIEQFMNPSRSGQGRSRSRQGFPGQGGQQNY